MNILEPDELSPRYKFYNIERNLTKDRRRNLSSTV